MPCYSLDTAKTHSWPPLRTTLLPQRLDLRGGLYIPVKGSVPWAASWQAGLGTAVGCRGCRKNKVWQLPGVGQQQQQQPASLEGLRLAGVGLSAAGEVSLQVEGKQCKGQASRARSHQAVPTFLPNNPAHLLHPGTCPAAQAPNWIRDMDTSEAPKDKNWGSTGCSSTMEQD